MIGTMLALELVFFLGFVALGVSSQDAESKLILQDLNSAEWDIANLNGSISFTAGRLPIMVLEGLVSAGILKGGDPIAG
jgi:hypothetical protein